jgi:hypothetical protein
VGFASTTSWGFGVEGQQVFWFESFWNNCSVRKYLYGGRGSIILSVFSLESEGKEMVMKQQTTWDS